MGKTSPDNISLQVKNFGPIVEADIELRPFTVFVGPSNTGKSWLAILIYALHRFFADRDDFPPGYRFRQFFDSRRPDKQTIEAIAEWQESILSDGGRLKRSDIVVPDSVVTELGKGISAGLEQQGSTLVAEICRCFGISDHKNMVRKNSRGSTHIAFGSNASNDDASVRHELKIADQTFKAGISNTALKNMMLQGDARRRYRKFIVHNLRDVSPVMLAEDGNEARYASRYIRYILRELVPLVMPAVFGSFIAPAYYLPADRTGIMHAHKVVVQSLLGAASMGGLEDMVSMPTLSGVLADFLKRLIAIDPDDARSRRPAPASRNDQQQTLEGMEKIEKLLEEIILNGATTIKKSNQTGYPNFFYRPDGWEEDLPLMHASSMVSELAPLVLYLRYVIRPGNVLIIEEPESHLHPGKQVELVRQLAAIVNAGVRLIVTTHSEWLLEELSNLVRLGGLSEKDRQGIGGGDYALDPKQVGVWLFAPKTQPKGTKVKELKPDKDTGLYDTGFMDIAENSHNDFAEISSRLEKQNNGAG